MRKIGLVIAVEIEAFERKYGLPDEVLYVRNQKVMKFRAPSYELYAVLSGAGEIAAAAAAQLLIVRFDVEMILNFGVVGGLTEEISRHRLCVVRDVVHYDFDTSEADGCEVGRYLEYPSIYIPCDRALLERAIAIAPELMPVTCASADKFVGSAQGKRDLHARFSAEICEMESAGIVLTCNRSGVPCLQIKMVSDGVEGGAQEFRREFLSASEKCLEVFERVIAGL